jgi:hypothetical protein
MQLLEAGTFSMKLHEVHLMKLRSYVLYLYRFVGSYYYYCVRGDITLVHSSFQVFRSSILCLMLWKLLLFGLLFDVSDRDFPRFRILLLANIAPLLDALQQLNLFSGT